MWLSGLRIGVVRVPAVVQWVKDLAWPWLWCLFAGLRFDPWPRNFYMPHVQSKKKKKKDLALSLLWHRFVRSPA